MSKVLKIFRKGFREVLRYFPIKKSVPTPILYGKLLKNRVAFITGGTKGIGYAIAKTFIKNGATVIITGRNHKTVSEAVGKLKKECNADNVYGFELDNSKVNDFEKKFNFIINNINGLKIDILVNNAGIMSKTSFWSATEDDFDLVLNTNLKGTYFLTKVVANYMIKNKIKGNILNVSSSSSIRPALTSYHFAKWGINGFTKGLAKELSSKNIVVNGIAPGPTSTEMILDGDNINRPSSPIKRFSTPDEIASLCCILVSDISRTIIGDTILATGGCGNLTFDDWN